jgi:hypothetical protein
MSKSIFFYKQLTQAEVGQTGTHEIYIRLSNKFDYESFFGNAQLVNDNGTVTINFEAINITNGYENAPKIPLRFVYYSNSNLEKRIPSLGELFAQNNVQFGDIVSIESRQESGNNVYYIHFYKKDEIQIDPTFFFFTTNGSISPIINKEVISSLQIIFYGAPGTGKSHYVKKLTNKNNSIRTTFHPDSDYASFVGAYKPITKKNIEDIYSKAELTNLFSEIKHSGTSYPCHKFG